MYSLLQRYAAVEADLETVRFLLGLGARKDFKNAEGKTAEDLVREKMDICSPSQRPTSRKIYYELQNHMGSQNKRKRVD